MTAVAVNDVQELNTTNSGPPQDPHTWKKLVSACGILVRAIAGGASVSAIVQALTGSGWTSQGDWKQAGLSAVVFTLLFLLRPVRHFLGEFKRRSSEGLERFAGTLAADAYHESARLCRIGWNTLFSRYEQKYCADLDFRLGTYRTQGLKESGAFALDLARVYVPLRLSPSTVLRVSNHPLKGAAPDAVHQIWEYLKKTKGKQPKRIVILARPGAGKTTLLEHLALTFSRNAQRRIDAKAPRLLPILLYLREVRERVVGEAPPDLPTLVSERLTLRKKPGLAPPSNWFEDRLSAENNRCLVMLDGLDEVASDEERQAVIRWVDHQVERYHHARFLLTSRPKGYEDAQSKYAEHVLEVQPFSASEVRAFVHNWFLQNEVERRRGRLNAQVREAAAEKYETLMREIDQSDALGELAVNPLLLTMITTVLDSQGAVPASRVAVYKEICEVMLVRRQKAKRLPDEGTNAFQKQAVLQNLALAMMLANTRTAAPQRLDEWLSTSVANVVGKRISARDFVDGIARRTGLIVERERDAYEFCHKSIQEYLAAREIVDTAAEAHLIAHIQESWWEETIRLYSAQANTENLIRAALLVGTSASLALAYDCWCEGLSTPTALQEELTQIVDAGLNSDDPKRLRVAAELRLNRRLRSLQQMGNGSQIDYSLVTNAEYALFVADQTDCAPLHWDGARFPAGQGGEPVTGTWPVAAERFFLWLERRDPLRKYRFPTSEEGNTRLLVTSKRHGFWCATAEGVRLENLSLEGWREEQEVLDLTTDPSNFPLAWVSPAEIEAQMLAIVHEPRATLDRDDPSVAWLVAIHDSAPSLASAICRCEIYLDASGALAPYRTRDVSQASAAATAAGQIAQSLAAASDLSSNSAATLDHVCALPHAVALAHARARDLVLATDSVSAATRAVAGSSLRSVASILAHALDRDLGRASSIATALASDLALAFELARGLSRDVDRQGALDLVRDLSHDCNLACSLAQELDTIRSRDSDSDPEQARGCVARARELATTGARNLARAIALASEIDIARTPGLVRENDPVRAQARAAAVALASEIDIVTSSDTHLPSETEEASYRAEDRAIDRAVKSASDSDHHRTGTESSPSLGALALTAALANALNAGDYQGWQTLAELGAPSPSTQLRSDGYSSKVSLRALVIALDLSRIYSVGHSKMYDLLRRQSSSTLDYLNLTKPQCATLCQLHNEQATAKARLLVWASLHAAREGRKYPGWEGIRIVRSKKVHDS